MEALVVAAGNRRRHRLQEACKRIGRLERHDILDIADAPAPFHPMIGGWTEDALYYHRPRTPDNEQAILILALEAEMAGKDAAIAEPRLHRKAHVDAGFGMPAAGQCRDFRRCPAAEDAHHGGGVRAHVEQTAAAEFGVVAKIVDRQRWNDELRIDLRERTVFGDEIPASASNCG